MNILNVVPKTAALIEAIYAAKQERDEQGRFTSDGGGGGAAPSARDISRIANQQESLMSEASDTRAGLAKALDAYDHPDGDAWAEEIDQAEELLENAQMDLMSADIAMQEGRDADSAASMNEAKAQMEKAKSLINGVRDEVNMRSIGWSVG